MSRPPRPQDAPDPLSDSLDAPTATATATTALEREEFTLSYPAGWHDYSENGFEADSDGIVMLTDVEIDPLAYDEIATLTDVPLGTVKDRIHQARKFVRERLSTGSA